MTTLTPRREAVDAAVAGMRRAHADALARDDADGIGMRMRIEASAAILYGVADLLDREVDGDLVWPEVAYALANPLSAFLMTVHGGDGADALATLPGALASIGELAALRLQAGPAAFGEGAEPVQHPPGRA